MTGLDHVNDPVHASLRAVIGNTGVLDIIAGLGALEGVAAVSSDDRV